MGGDKYVPNNLEPKGGINYYILYVYIMLSKCLKTRFSLHHTYSNIWKCSYIKFFECKCILTLL